MGRTAVPLWEKAGIYCSPGQNQIPNNVQPSLGGWQFYHGPQIMTSTRLIFEIFLVLMWRPYCVQFCSLHILLYLIRQITGSDLSQTYVRKYYLHLGPDAGVSRGVKLRVYMYFYCCNDFVWSYWGFFFILRLTYILWQCAYIWHRPLGFTMTRDFGFLCIKIGFFCVKPAIHSGGDNTITCLWWNS